MLKDLRLLPLTSALIRFLLIMTLTSSPLIATAETSHRELALLVDGFVTAMDAYGQGDDSHILKPDAQFWREAFEQRDIDRNFMRERLLKQASTNRRNRFASYQSITVERSPNTPQAPTQSTPVALQPYRLDVIEDYDDVFNDDLYAYFVVTHDNLVWGHVTETYKGLGENTSVILSPKDQKLFGPKGQKLPIQNELIVDYGIIESDGDDAEELRKLSGAILDLAAVALSLSDPRAALAAPKLRAEIKNLLQLVVDLDTDDRLVSDTFKIRPQDIGTWLLTDSSYEFSRHHQRRTMWSHFSYRLGFRLLR